MIFLPLTSFQEIVKGSREKNVKFRILVDYVMTENFQPWLEFLNSQPGFEVKRFRPASPQFLTFLSKDLDMKNPENFI